MGLLKQSVISPELVFTKEPNQSISLILVDMPHKILVVVFTCAQNSEQNYVVICHLAVLVTILISYFWCFCFVFADTDCV